MMALLSVLQTRLVFSLLCVVTHNHQQDSQVNVVLCQPIFISLQFPSFVALLVQAILFGDCGALTALDGWSLRVLENAACDWM